MTQTRQQKQMNKKKNQMHNIDPKKVDVGLIKEAIQYGENNIKRTQNCKHSVIFWGFTGAGKSCTIIALSGKKLHGYLRGFSILTTPDNIKGVGKVFIEEKGISGTAYPAKEKMKTSQNQDAIMLWDSAGLADTKGITQILVNTYFIYRIFNIQQQLKMIFTFNAKDLDGSDKGKGFQKTVETLTSVLANFQNYHECMGVLVTKTRNDASESDFYDLIKDRINEYKGERTDRVKHFFDLLLNKQLKVIYIKQPNVGAHDKQTQPKDVTNDYKEFRNQFYKLILSLKSARSPKLNTLGLMQSTQLQKCKDYAKQVMNSLKGQRESLFAELSKFILGKLQSVQFSDNLENNRKHLLAIKNVKQLRQKITTYCKQSKQLSQKPRLIFEKLKTLFQHADHDFACEYQQNSSKDKVKYCIPLRKYKNDLIIIEFLSTIKINDMAIGSDLEIQHLFQYLHLKFDQLWNLMLIQIEKAMNKFKYYLVYKFQSHFKKWMRQEVSKNWKESFTIMPSLSMKAGIFMTSTTFESYFAQIRALEKIGDMSCTADLVEIQDMVKYNKSTANLTLLENKFIEENISKICQNVQNQMDDYLNYKSWSKEVVNKHVENWKNIKKDKDGIKQKQQNEFKRREDDLSRKEDNMKKKELILKKKQQSFRKRDEETTQISKSISRDLAYPRLQQKKYFQADRQMITQQQITYLPLTDGQIAQQQLYFKDRLQIQNVLDLSIQNKPKRRRRCCGLCCIQ